MTVQNFYVSTKLKGLEKNVKLLWAYVCAGADVVKVRRQNDRQHRPMCFFAIITYHSCQHHLLFLADSQHIHTRL